jgi:lipopolysaccharide export system protein LptC
LQRAKEKADSIEAVRQPARAAAKGTDLTIATHTAGVGTHAWRASGPRDLARLIRNARRHSARVRALRIGVPAAAFTGLGIIVLVTWFNPLRTIPPLPVSAGNLVVSGTKITMEAPKVTGYTRDNRAYNITAEAAAQDITNPTVLELTGIRAKIEMQNNATVDMTAVAGVYDTKAEVLTLTQYIVLISSEGYEGHLTEAKADVRKGNVVSEKPVEILMKNGKLVASRMDVIDSGALVRFDAGVVLDLTSTPSGPADKKAPRPPGAFQGFSVNRDKPVQIRSTTLEVRDKEKKATFLGNVHMTQGDTTVKSNSLDVFYEREGDSTAAKKAPSEAADQQQIRRIEAKGGVTITQRDQTATGDTGIFDTRANTVMLIGNVVITQGPQVIKGERLMSDLTSGVSQVEGKVSGVMFPKSQKVSDAKAGDAKGAQPSGPPNALQGFSVNRDKPVQITSNTLEVRDKEKKAIFAGNVLVAQGEATMKSKTLDVYYDQDGDAAGPSDQQIRRIEAKGGVVVAQKDQTATGDTGIFDMRTNTVTLIGDVVSTQGQQVIKGERLTIDLSSGLWRVGGRVGGLFLPNSRPKTGDKLGDKAEDGKAAETPAEGRDARPEPGRGKDTSKPSAKSSSGQPLRLN